MLDVMFCMRTGRVVFVHVGGSVEFMTRLGRADDVLPSLSLAPSARPTEKTLPRTKPTLQPSPLTKPTLPHSFQLTLSLFSSCFALPPLFSGRRFGLPSWPARRSRYVPQSISSGPHLTRQARADPLLVKLVLLQPLRQPMRMQTTTVAASPVHSHTPVSPIFSSELAHDVQRHHLPEQDSAADLPSPFSVVSLL